MCDTRNMVELLTCMIMVATPPFYMFVSFCRVKGVYLVPPHYRRDGRADYIYCSTGKISLMCLHFTSRKVYRAPSPPPSTTRSSMWKHEPLQPNGSGAQVPNSSCYTMTIRRCLTDCSADRLF